MLHPVAWSRRKAVEKAVGGYPMYDPPHKVEERLVPRGQAVENFDYFMACRVQRAAHFHSWLNQKFSMTVDPDSFASIITWAPKFAVFLMPLECDTPRKVFYAYEPHWEGAFIGVNALFDLGIAYGEFLIAHRPELSWAMENPNWSEVDAKIAGFSDETARKLLGARRDIDRVEREQFGGYRRPRLIRAHHPIGLDPLGAMYGHCVRDMRRTTELAWLMNPHRHLDDPAIAFKRYIQVNLLKTDQERLSFMQTRPTR